MAGIDFGDSFGSILGGLAGTYADVQKAKYASKNQKYATGGQTPGEHVTDQEPATALGKHQTMAQRASTAVSSAKPMILWGVGAIVVSVIAIKLIK